MLSEFVSELKMAHGNQVAMGELNRLMRSELQAFASREVAALKEAQLWSFRNSMASDEKEDTTITLGCFIPGSICFQFF